MKSHLLKMFLLLSLCVSSTVVATGEPTNIDRKKSRLLKLVKDYHQIEREYNVLFEKKLKEIEKTYYLLLNKAGNIIPPAPAPKDLFETEYEYNTRMENYKKKVLKTAIIKKNQIKKTHKEFNLRYRISLAEIEHYEAKIKELSPLVEKISNIQNETHSSPDGNLKIVLFPPEADNFRFPLHLISEKEKWVRYWDYSDRKKARTLWQNKSYMYAEMRNQFEFTTGNKILTKITVIQVSNTKTGDRKIFKIGEVKPVPVLEIYNNMVKNELPAAKLMAALKNVVTGPVSGMEFIYISPRSFSMGSPRHESGRWANELQHRVRLTKGFYIQTTEVTQRQWRTIMRGNPSGFSNCGSDCPVENIYWGEVQEFIRRVNKIEKTTKYRLPTEAEWEYACRAGNKYFGANDNSESKLPNYAWYFDNSEGTPHPVALKKPNRWGLFDMQGNVSEWCNDWAGAYSPKETIDPKGPFTGKFRIARGGNWQMSSRSCRAADRNFNLPGDRGDTIGFRLVKSP